MDLEALMVARANEQMGAESWRLPDADETRRSEHKCLHCGTTDLKRWALFCHECSQAGWRKGPCPNCGGPVNVKDRIHGGTHVRAKDHNHESRTTTYWSSCSRCRGKLGRPPVVRDEAWERERDRIRAQRELEREWNQPKTSGSRAA